MTVEKLIDGIAGSLHEAFGFPIYTEHIEQDLRAPCFLVLCDANRGTRLPGGRYRHSADMSIVYFPKDGKKEMDDVSDRLVYLMEFVDTDSGKVRTRDRSSVISDNTLVFTFNVLVHERIRKDTDVMLHEETVFRG